MLSAKNVSLDQESQKLKGSQWDGSFDMSKTKPKVETQYSSPISLSQDEIPETCYDKKYLYRNKPTLSRTENWCDDIPLGQKCFENDYKEIKLTGTRDIGTMTDQSSAKYLELETKGNELFGQMMACEISNVHGKARYDKMKEIIGLFQTLNND